MERDELHCEIARHLKCPGLLDGAWSIARREFDHRAESDAGNATVTHVHCLVHNRKEALRCQSSDAVLRDGGILILMNRRFGLAGSKLRMLIERSEGAAQERLKCTSEGLKLMIGSIVGQATVPGLQPGTEAAINLRDVCCCGRRASILFQVKRIVCGICGEAFIGMPPQ